jgi:nicotinamide mononucleotide adenylyltransferase
MTNFYNRKKQSKNITEDWKYIIRYNDIERRLSKSARHILSSVLYQINKYKHAILTHYELSQITEAKNHQNCNLVKQLGFVIDFQFKRSVVINEKKYRDCYVFFKNKNTDKILENPEKYFTNVLRKNSQITEKKFSDESKKILRSPESLHIYNKNKEKIDKKIYLDNLPSNSIEKSVETVECKIANSECAEKSHNGVAREECIGNAQAKKQTAEPVKNGYSQLGEPILLLNYVFTDAMLLEAIKASDKKHYTPKQVKVILRNLLEKYPGKIIFGGNRGFIKYLIKVINGEIDYEYQAKYHLSKLDKATTMAEIQAEKQKAIDERFQLLLQGKVKSLSRAEEYYG